MAARMAAATAPKVVRKVIPAPRPHWVGNGFHVFPVFGELAFTEELSPWLMFDYAAPKEFEPSKTRRGVGQHPHRGFETITIAFQGEVEHGDSVGNHDVIGPGDVQVCYPRMMEGCSCCLSACTPFPMCLHLIIC